MSTPNFKLQFTNWQQEGIQSSRHQQGNICLSKCLLCHSLCLSQGFCEQLQEAECCIFRGRNNSPISAVLMHPFMSHFSTTLVVLLHAIQQHLCLCYWNKCVEACCTVNSRFKIKLGNRGCWEREWEVLMVGGKNKTKKHWGIRSPLELLKRHFSLSVWHWLESAASSIDTLAVSVDDGLGEKMSI